ncbi:jg22658 [Pararge aegeria aegeria]|uniref:Jg22658 protein n=1 Tax=Pararge aegeria aegeria TaxID=348720 RepID=A0A8S4R7A4_9NEOP|nr:jg22658 [Pararge aegeria aegeria]
MTQFNLEDRVGQVAYRSHVDWRASKPTKWWAAPATCRDRYSEREWRDKTPEDVIHPVPDARTRERVPLQPVPDAEETDRDRARALPHRAPNQNLVPESAHEVEERA